MDIVRKKNYCHRKFLRKSALEDKDYIDFSHIVVSFFVGAKIEKVLLQLNTFLHRSSLLLMLKVVLFSTSKAGRLEPRKFAELSFLQSWKNVERSKRSCCSDYDGDYEGEYRKDPFPSTSKTLCQSRRWKEEKF